MERGIIEADPRHTTRRIRTAMQGSAIRALVELITNSADSYSKIEDTPSGRPGLIQVLRRKEGTDGVFAVRDFAAGMSIDEVRNGFKKYGADTSGRKQGKRVRGYFGQGAKDALASMHDGRICTFRDGVFVECRIFCEHDKPWYEISTPEKASLKLRKLHGIEHNGTVAYFTVRPDVVVHVPGYEKVQEELAENYQLRKIMSSESRVVELINCESGDKRRLWHATPRGKLILSEEFTLSFGPLQAIPVKMTLFRAETELEQSGDTRAGGLLLLDEFECVLGISLFRFDHEPLANRFFGEVKIGKFGDLLDMNEAVLKEERDGLAERHPFCQQLVVEIEKRLDEQVRAERERKKREAQAHIDPEEWSRYKKALKLLNEVAENETERIETLGPGGPEGTPLKVDDIELYPRSATVTVGKKYNFQLRVNSKLAKGSAVVRMSCNNGGVRLLTPEVKIAETEDKSVILKYVTIEPKEPNVTATISATLGQYARSAVVQVVPEKELLLAEGLVFQPETLTLRPNQPRRVFLCVYVKVIENGSQIVISSSNDTIHASETKVTVHECEAVWHIAKYEIDVWGEGVGQDAIITATGPYDRVALLEVKVRSKEDSAEAANKGMFGEPEYNDELDPLQRTSYSSETGKITIYLNFPTVRHYLGDRRQHARSVTGQVFVADLIAERCFLEIARRKVEQSALIRPEGKHDKIQAEAAALSRKYGQRVHEVLVDQKLLLESR